MSSFSQDKIRGIVTNNREEPIIVNVLLQKKGLPIIIGFTQTNEKGEYWLNYQEGLDSIDIVFTGMNIDKTKKTIPVTQKILNIVIEEKLIQLNEVTVIPSKIKRSGDTLNYSVSSYIQQEDRVIGDVIKKLPGIEVSPSGAISYRGQSINRFYIENLDLLQGRYGIATNNISAKDISTIQVLENHHPIKALEKIDFSDAAAINLKLKEEAKGTVAITSLLGAGYKPLSWEVELSSMYFNKNLQNITTYSSNNVGKDLSSELRSHYNGERLLLSPRSMLSVQELVTPPIPLKRYYNNNSHVATINHLYKIRDSLELITNIAYHNSFVKKEGYYLNEQYLPNNDFLVIEEDMTSKAKTHNIEASVKLNSNKSNYYLNNYLNLNGRFNNISGNTNSSSRKIVFNEYIQQKLIEPSFGLDNTFNWIKNIGKKTYNLYWATAYINKPHRLAITPAYHFNSDSIYSTEQEVLSKRLATNLRTSYKIHYKNFDIDYTLWTRLDLQNLKSELQGISNTRKLIVVSDTLKNDLSFNNYQFGLNQSYTYNGNKLKMSVGIPLYYFILNTNDYISENVRNYKKIIVNPYFSLNYVMSHELSMGIGANYSKNIGDINSSYSGYIMQDYRNLLRNNIDNFLESESIGTNLTLSYANAFDALFINLKGSYLHSKSNLLYGNNYTGIMSIRTVINQPTSSNRYNTNFSVSKGLNFWSTTLRIYFNVSNTTSDVLVQNKILKSHFDGWNTGSSINSRPFSFLNMQYSFSLNQGQSYVIGQSSHFPKIRTIIQNGQLNVFPSKQLTVSANVEHQYNALATNKNITFADIGAVLKHKKIDYELEINNVFNIDYYISTLYNSINTYFFKYKLRPTSILFKMRFKLK